MNDPKFTTVASSLSTGGYRGVMQHEQIFDQDAALAELASGTAYNKADIKTVLQSFVKVLKKKMDLGQAVVVDGALRFYQTVKGGFASSVGPWDSAVNSLAVTAQSLSPLRTTLANITPVNNTEGAKPSIDTVLCEGEYDVISGTGATSITGKNLLIDTSKTDEFVALVKSDGTIAVKGTLSVNRLTYIEATFALTGLTSGEYTLAVFTRSGMGSEYGVAKATRKVTVVGGVVA